MANYSLKSAEAMIRHVGGRVTRYRVRILSLLLAAQQALSHREIEEQLGITQQLDRVTLYRVLSWMNQNNLVHRVASDDRVWRFRANVPTHSHRRHAHFECTACEKVICLDTCQPEFSASLPSGYLYQEVQLTVKGLCAECA